MRGVRLPLRRCQKSVTQPCGASSGGNGKYLIDKAGRSSVARSSGMIASSVVPGSMNGTSSTLAVVARTSSFRPSSRRTISSVNSVSSGRRAHVEVRQTLVLLARQLIADRGMIGRHGTHPVHAMQLRTRQPIRKALQPQ